MTAARGVFADKGFNRTTMEDIARRAELSPGTLYLYFKSKEELYASLSLRVLHYLQLRLERVCQDQNLDFEGKLEALGAALYEVYQFDPLIIIKLFHLQSSETLINLSPRPMSEIKDLSARSISAMAKIFEEGIQKGVLVDSHPVALADILWSLFSGVVLWESSKKIIDANKDFLRPTFETAFEIFLRGLKRPSPGPGPGGKVSKAA